MIRAKPVKLACTFAQNRRTRLYCSLSKVRESESISFQMTVSASASVDIDETTPATWKQTSAARGRLSPPDTYRTSVSCSLLVALGRTARYRDQLFSSHAEVLQGRGSVLHETSTLQTLDATLTQHALFSGKHSAR